MNINLELIHSVLIFPKKCTIVPEKLIMSTQEADGRGPTP